MDKARQFQQSLWEIQKRFGEHALMTLAERGAIQDTLAFGFPALDEVLESGGIARGQMSALMGKPSCGATTLALKMLASAQGRAEASIYFDLSRTFDPDYAATCGVVLDRLLLIQPTDGLQMLEIARELIKVGTVSLMVLDLLTTNITPYRSALPIPLRRLHEALATSRTGVLFLMRAPVDALEPYLQTCIRLQRLDWLYLKDEGEDVVGYQVQATVLKHKPYPAGGTATLDIRIDPSVEGNHE